LDAPLALFPRQAVHVGDELEKLSAGELFVEIGLVRHITDHLPRLVSLLLQIKPADADGSRSGKKKPAHQLDGGGLARPVGPEESEQFPGRNAQTQALDGDLGPVCLGHLIQFNHAGYLLMIPRSNTRRMPMLCSMASWRTTM